MATRENGFAGEIDQGRHGLLRPFARLRTPAEVPGPLGALYYRTPNTGQQRKTLGPGAGLLLWRWGAAAIAFCSRPFSMTVRMGGARPRACAARDRRVAAH